MLTLVEAMRSEWGCTLRQALFGESINAALVLWPAMMARYGAEPGMNYVDRARQKAKDDARRWLEENYTIVSATPK